MLTAAIDFLLAFLIVWIYKPALKGPFLFDDLVILAAGPDQYLNLEPRQNPYSIFKSGNPFAVLLTALVTVGNFVRKYGLVRGLYMYFIEVRPLAMFSYNLDAWLHGLDVKSWHITSIGVHVVATWTVHWILQYWFSPIPAAAGALVFAVHPLATMAVAYISGRSSALCGMFMISAVLCTLEHSYVGAGFMALAAILTKPESVLLVPAIGGLLCLYLN